MITVLRALQLELMYSVCVLENVCLFYLFFFIFLSFFFRSLCVSVSVSEGFLTYFCDLSLVILTFLDSFIYGPVISFFQ